MAATACPFALVGTAQGQSIQAAAAVHPVRSCAAHEGGEVCEHFCRDVVEGCLLARQDRGGHRGDSCFSNHFAGTVRDHLKPCKQNVPMDTIGAKEEMASLLAKQDVPTLAQVLLELAEDFAPVYERLERLRLRDDSAALSARFNQQLQRWKSDDRFVAYKDAAGFGRELDAWIAQVQREVLPRFPSDAMALFAAFLELDRVVFERVDDDGGYVGGAFELACRLWLTAAAAAGLSGAEIASRASAILSADNYGARYELNRAITR